MLRRLLVASVALAFVGAGGALALPPAATIDLSATVTPACTIGAYSPTLDLTGKAVDEYAVGDFNYQCNFVGTPTITLASANGGLLNDPDGAGPQSYLRTYGVFLADGAISGTPSTWTSSGSLGSYVTGTSTTAPNSNTTPGFAVGPTQPLDVAGNFVDTLTISIAP